VGRGVGVGRGVVEGVRGRGGRGGRPSVHMTRALPLRGEIARTMRGEIARRSATRRSEDLAGVY